MDEDEWHQRYKRYFIEHAALTPTEAEDTLQAGIGCYDYSESPEDTALEELSYWTEG